MDEYKLLEESILNQIDIIPRTKYVPQFNPTNENSGIIALTYDNVDYKDKKTKVFAYFGMPKHKLGEKVPAVILLHGGLGHAYACWVKMWNDRGYAAIAMDHDGFYPTVVNAGSSEVEDKKNWAREFNEVFAEDGYIIPPQEDYMNIGDKPFTEHWVYHAVCSTIRAHNILRLNPDIDAERIGITGISWGSVIATIVIGYDNRLSFAVPVYGSGYLSQGYSLLDKAFMVPRTYELWSAEKRFDSVNFPVFWLAWNDDSPFSINSCALSYEHTYKFNNKTRMATKDKMMHSHGCGWAPQEIYSFADWITGNENSPFPNIFNESDGRKIKYKIINSTAAKIIGAKIYYINSKMVFSVVKRYNTDWHALTEEWSVDNCDIIDDNIVYNLPNTVCGYYIELTFSLPDAENLVITAPYVEF